MSFSLKDDVLKAVRDGDLGGYISPASVRLSPPKTGSKINKDCPYETPCGWCSKWDKKCDAKIPKRGLRAKTNVIDETFIPCSECAHEDWDMPQCKECNAKNDFKYFERKRKNND